MNRTRKRLEAIAREDSRPVLPFPDFHRRMLRASSSRTTPSSVPSAARSAAGLAVMSLITQNMTFSEKASLLEMLNPSAAARVEVVVEGALEEAWERTVSKARADKTRA